MVLSRNLTNRVNWILDNILPPVLRDSPVLMVPLFYLFFRKKYRAYLEFKVRAVSLTAAEYSGYYKYLADTFVDRDTDLARESVALILQSLRGSSVLDIGCGRGYLSGLMGMDERRFVVAADLVISGRSLRPGNVRFIGADLERLPFQDRSFDTVVSAHTLEHVLNFDVALAELRRVTRQRLIVIVPKQREYKYTFDLHLQYFPYEHSLRNVMKRPDAHIEVAGNDLFYWEDRG